MPKSDLYKSAYNKACSYLARRDYSVLELYKKLEAFYGKKFYKQPENLEKVPQVVSEVIKKLQEDNLLSNQRFVDIFIMSKLGRFNGPLLIQRQLHRKGITNEMFLENWSKYEDQEPSFCAKGLRKWFKQQKPDFDINDKLSQKKAERYLFGKGFYRHTVYECVQALAKEIR